MILINKSGQKDFIAKIMRKQFNHLVSRCDWFNDASPVSQTAQGAIKSIKPNHVVLIFARVKQGGGGLIHGEVYFRNFTVFEM